MKVQLGFNPNEHDYGPPSQSVRQILLLWENIDWFESKPSKASAKAAEHFEKYNAIAYRWMPNYFAPEVNQCLVRGGHSEFESLFRSVKYPQAKWDWKHSGLKMLSKKHSDEKGWSEETQKNSVTISSASQSDAQVGNLFTRIIDPNNSSFGITVWASIGKPPQWKSILPSEHAAEAIDYFSFSQIDFVKALQWQLAENHDDTTGNPFLHLLHIYALGFYPIVLSADQVVLFAFER